MGHQGWFVHGLSVILKLYQKLGLAPKRGKVARFDSSVYLCYSVQDSSFKGANLKNYLKLFIFLLSIAFVALSIFAIAYAQGGDVSRGKQLFDQNCAVCHGDRAQGRVGPRLSKDFPGIRVDLFLKSTISNGVEGTVMPAWSKERGGPLTDAEIDDIVAFIQSLGHVAPTVLITPGPTVTLAPLPSPVSTFPPGDAARGATTFAQNCAVCHGTHGEGRIGATLQKEWPGINVEAFLDATVARGVSGTKMPAWAQSNGGPLSNQDIADVAAFIRTLKPGRQPTSTVPGIPQAGPLGGPIALACGGLVVLVGIVVLVIALGSRSRAKKKT